MQGRLISRHNRWLAAFLPLVLSHWVNPAASADIRTISLHAQNAEVGADRAECNYVLEGLIEPGDAEKIAAAFRVENTYQPGADYGQLVVLCLNSDGGSFNEAVEISKLFQKSNRTSDLGTMIRKGDRCLSACAIIFMNGRYFAYEVGEFPWRYMHREAELGFHSPSLVFPESIYDKSTVELAYADALRSVSSVMHLLVLPNDYDGARWMEPSLLAQMLATPPSEMFYVETIDHIGRWNIGLFPSVKFDYEQLDVATGCRNITSWTVDESPLQSTMVSADGLIIERTSPQYEGQAEGYKVIEAGMWERGCKFENESVDSGGRQYVRVTPYTDLGDQRLQLASGYHFLDHRILLKDIGTPAEADAMVDKRECKVLAPTGAIIDSEVCLYSATDPTGLRSEARTEFTWPSGSKTVITYAENQMDLLLNGGPTKLVDLLEGHACFKSEKTGNVFCYSSTRR